MTVGARMMGVLAACLLACGDAPDQTPETSPRRKTPNILMIVADDLNWDSVGCYGSEVAGVSPHIDQLAAEGMRFERAHVTIAACQPSRSVWMTGRYPFHNGANGFEPIRKRVPTLVEQLGSAGYFRGILGKIEHLEPAAKFPWDHEVPSTELGWGRDRELYYEATRGFLERAREEGKPFFLMANSHDPKRPFAGSVQAEQKGREYAPARRVFTTDEVSVPPSLPDLPEIRQEVAEYFTSVHRFDDILGQVLRALAEAGRDQDTVVLFMSDHGMAFPFAKMNCYLASTMIPCIVRWPGVVPAGSVDSEHFVSGVDVMPTVLEIAGAEEMPRMDGSSFVPLLRGEPQQNRDRVLTLFQKTTRGNWHRMRSVHQGRFGYIFNGWANGQKQMQIEAMSGLTYDAMAAAARDDEDVAARVALLRYRVPEELYDYEADPWALHNLIDDPAHREDADRMRRALLEAMREARDPLTPRFAQFAGL